MIARPGLVCLTALVGLPPWRTHPHIDAAIAERARSTLGLLTIPGLTALGVTRQTRRTLVANGGLVPVGGGVLRHAAWPPSWEQSSEGPVPSARALR
jgi:hypothetical protein